MRTTFVFVLALAACDSRAKASDPDSRADAKSKEHESCGASLHCADGLRCFEQTCRRVARSNVGDFFAALGAAKRGMGDLDGAAAAYNQALGHYDTEKLKPPPAEIICAYGGALAANKRKQDQAELGARVLHRCLIALGPGSGGALRDRAFADLAALDDMGIEPLTLGSTTEADRYLHGAARPATDKLTVTVTATPAAKGASTQTINDKLNEPGTKSALVSCWEAYNAAAHKDALVATIGLKVSYYQNPDFADDPDSGGYSTKIDPPGALKAGSPEAAADQCVRAVVEPAIKDLKLHESVSTKLAIAIK
jgi:hypothetical protein